MSIMVKNAAVPVRVEIDPDKFRPSEVPVFVGLAKKIERYTGWKPEREHEDTILETIDWWRAKVKEKK